MVWELPGWHHGPIKVNIDPGLNMGGPDGTLIQTNTHVSKKTLFGI
jgi:hypothetical protein